MQSVTQWNRNQSSKEQSLDARCCREELENRRHKTSHTAGLILGPCAVDLDMITKSLGGNTKEKHAVKNISNTQPAAARKVNVMLRVVWHNLKKESSSASDKLGGYTE